MKTNYAIYKILSLLIGAVTVGGCFSPGVNNGGVANRKKGADPAPATPAVSFSVATQSVTEGNAGNTTLTVTVTTAVTSASAITVPVTLSAGTATDGGVDH